MYGDYYHSFAKVEHLKQYFAVDSAHSMKVLPLGVNQVLSTFESIKVMEIFRGVQSDWIDFNPWEAAFAFINRLVHDVLLHGGQLVPVVGTNSSCMTPKKDVVGPSIAPLSSSQVISAGFPGFNSPNDEMIFKEALVDQLSSLAVEEPNLGARMLNFEDRNRIQMIVTDRPNTTLCLWKAHS
ncbi:hypothetical protein GH714_011500 [Hevea brasiliensis]|uniref:Uncharacterized protein n=1 Tax=Hevea brasiliensis TaxID=3981 RepID=A0A6A6MII5_HEVBR|nr:hypothetical protein GH714_011500 [Hevea brasiliensis]